MKDIKMGSDAELSRDLLVDTVMPIIMVVFIVCYVFFFVGMVLWYFLSAAMYLVIALLIAYIMKKQLPTEALFRTAVYAKVPMFVVATLFNAFSFMTLSVPISLRVVITVVFMGFAIAKLPDRQYM